MTDDITDHEINTLLTLHHSRHAWTRANRIPPDALDALIERGLAEVSKWRDEWAKLTDDGHAAVMTP